MGSYMQKDWTAKGREARRLFKALDSIDGRDKEACAQRKALRRRAKAAKAESEYIMKSWMESGHYKELRI